MRSFEILVQRYEDYAFNLAYRIVKNREEAEEVAQDAFVKDAGREKPSKGFSQRVMAAVESTRATISPNTPVIAPWVLRLIFGRLAVFYAVVLFFSPEQTGKTTYLDKVKAFTEKNSLNVPDVSLPAVNMPNIDWSFFGTSPVFAYSLLALATMAIFMAWKQSHETAFSRNK